MDFYDALFNSLLYPAWETGLRRRPTLSILRELTRTQYTPLEELEAQQARSLSLLLRHAWENVPHYRQRFEQAGFHPDHFRELSDLQRVPLLSKAEATSSGQDREARNGATVDIRKSTSGSTGQPLSFGYERNSEYWRQATKLRGYSWAGHRPGCKTFHYWGAGSPFLGRAGKLKVAVDHYVRREEYYDCGRRADSDLDAVMTRMRELRPQVLVCFAQAGADLARRIIERNVHDFFGMSVICGGERLFPKDREALIEAFGCNVFETYGCREFMLIGAECEAHDGLHTSMENLVVEVLVRERDEQGREICRPGRPGEVGEVVITDLHNWAMPFIRYANGDLAQVGQSRRCSCGRSLARLGPIEGRVAETLHDAKGNRINGLIFNSIVAHVAEAIKQFQVVQRADSSILLRFVPTERYDAKVEEILRGVWGRYLPDVPFILERVADIPLSSAGKRRVVVVET